MLTDNEKKVGLIAYDIGVMDTFKKLLTYDMLKIDKTNLINNNGEWFVNVYFSANEENKDIRYKIKDRYFKPTEISEEYNINDGRVINLIAIFLGIIEENGIKKYNNCGYNIRNGKDAFISEKYKGNTKTYERLYYTEKGYDKIKDFINDKDWRINYYEENMNSLSANEKRIYNFLKKIK